MKTALLLLALGAVCSAASANEKPAQAPLPACVHVKTEARYGAFGYDHIVSINNSCDKTADCAVSTDVNPEVIDVVVRSQSEESVVTFRGSPAYEFSAKVSCTLRG